MSDELKEFWIQEHSRLGSYGAVANEYGLTPYLVRKYMTEGAKHKPNSVEKNSPIKGLSTRAVSYLSENGLTTPDMIKKFYYAHGLDGLKSLNNIGLKTARQIQEWVEESDPLLEIDVFNNLVENLVRMEALVGFKAALNRLIKVFNLDDDQTRMLVINYVNREH